MLKSTTRTLLLAEHFIESYFHLCDSLIGATTPPISFCMLRNTVATLQGSADSGRGLTRHPDFLTLDPNVQHDVIAIAEKLETAIVEIDDERDPDKKWAKLDPDAKADAMRYVLIDDDAVRKLREQLRILPEGCGAVALEGAEDPLPAVRQIRSMIKSKRSLAGRADSLISSCVWFRVGPLITATDTRGRSIRHVDLRETVATIQMYANHARALMAAPTFSALEQGVQDDLTTIAEEHEAALAEFDDEFNYDKKWAKLAGDEMAKNIALQQTQVDCDALQRLYARVFWGLRGVEAGAKATPQKAESPGSALAA